MPSPFSRTLLAIARIESQAQRSRRISLSDFWQSDFVERVVRGLGLEMKFTRPRLNSSGSCVAKTYYRLLRLENLEQRQMLSVNVPSMPILDAASDTGSSTTDGNTNDSTPTFIGSSDVNSLVKLGTWLDANADAIVDDGEVSNTVDVNTAESGSYSATLGTLADGNYLIVAKAFDELGNPSVGSNNGWSNALSIVVDTSITSTTVDLTAASDSVAPTTAPPGTDSDDRTSFNTPVFQGTAEPGATIELFDGANATPIATATADGSGDWATLPLATALTDGVHSITARATDQFGNSATSGPLAVTIDTLVTSNTAPDMTAATDSGSSASDRITNNHTPTFTGTTEDDPTSNVAVELLLEGVTVIATGNALNGVWTLTPGGAISDGTHTVQARVTDQAGNVSTSGATTIVIDTVGPAATNDVDGTNEDIAVTIAVVSNDTDTSELPLTVIGVTHGAQGTVFNNGDGTVTYTPNLNFNGGDTFTYTIVDVAGNSATATVNVTVNAVNDPPSAVNDTATTGEDTPVTTGNVLANDTDVDDDLVPSSITAFSQGANGAVVSHDDGTFTYTPNANFHGSDSFTYTISDGVLSATATVTIEVAAHNDAPTAVDDAASTNEDTAVTVAVLANDNAGPADEVQTLTVTATTDGANGVVTTDGTNVTYTPSLDFNGSDTFTYTITDDGGLTATAIVTVTVGSVNDVPIVTISNSSISVNEGSPASNAGSFSDVDSSNVTITASVGTITQTPGAAGSYTWSLPTTDGPDDSQLVTITATASDGGVSTVTFSLIVNNMPPVVIVTGTSAANDGQTLTYSFAANDPGPDSTYSRTITSSNPLDVVTPLAFNPSTGSGTFKVKFHGPVGTSTSTLTVNVTEAGGAATGSGTLDVVVKNTFRVMGIVVNNSGFDFTFNSPIDFTNLNLYDGINPLLPGDALKPSDVVVHAAVANFDIKGSVVWSAATNTLSWVRSGGVLGADTYFIKLLSGGNAFRDIGGNLLDGNSDFVAGDDYQQSVPISVLGGTPFVTLPDFARGPGQRVDLTAANTLDTSFPIRATGVNVQGVDFKLVYDTALLTIDPDQVTAALPNWSVAANQSIVGTTATLIVSASANLPSAAFAGTVAFVNIQATVPSTAPYGATQVLRLMDSAVNEINAQNDYAIQKVAFPGDANGSGVVSSSPPNAYTGEDAALIARVIVGAMGTTGFDAYPLVDPAIVGDASGNGGASLSAFDTSLISQESAGINTPEVPDGTAQGSGGSALYDPLLSIPDDFPVFTDQTYELPVNITIEPSVVGIISATYTVKYQIHDLEFLGASNGSDFLAPGWTMMASELAPGTIRVSIFSAFPSGNNGGAPLQLGKLNFVVRHAANLGSSPLQIDPVDPHESGLAWTKDDGSVFISRFAADYNFDNSVDAADYVSWRKRASTNGNGSSNETSYAIWRSSFGSSFPAAGAQAAVAAASISEPEPVLSANTTEPIPVAARDEVWTGFALGTRFTALRTTPTAPLQLPGSAGQGGGALLNVVTALQQKSATDTADSWPEGGSSQYVDAVEELWSGMDCAVLKGL